MARTREENFRLYKAKAEHKIMQREQPQLFAEQRLDLISMLMANLKGSTPRWGGLHLTLFKTKI